MIGSCLRRSPGYPPFSRMRRTRAVWSALRDGSKTHMFLIHLNLCKQVSYDRILHPWCRLAHCIFLQCPFSLLRTISKPTFATKGYTQRPFRRWGAAIRATGGEAGMSPLLSLRAARTGRRWPNRKREKSPHRSAGAFSCADIVDLRGKHGRVRSIPMPGWAKAAIDQWASAAEISTGPVFRGVNKGDRLQKIKPSSPGRLAAVTCASATPRSSRTVLEHGWFRQEPPPVVSIAAW